MFNEQRRRQFWDYFRFLKDPITNGGQLYKKNFLVLKNCFNDKLHVNCIHFWLICINF